MAVVKYVKAKTNTRGAMYGLVKYCLQDKKVYDEITGRRMVSGINCNGENAYIEFMTTKQAYNKAEGMFYYQYIQSFSSEENITPNEAHNLAREFAEAAWPDHEILITTHTDTPHIHSHFVINSVNYKNGYKLRQDRHTLEKLRQLSDEICIKHGYTIIKNPQKRHGYISDREYKVAMKGESWKFKLMNDIDTAMKYSGSRQEFENEMRNLGYEMTWTDERKYITFHCPGGRKCRDIKLHDDKYLKGSIENELKYREQLKKQHYYSETETTESGYSEQYASDTISADSVRNPRETTGIGNETNTDGNNISADIIQPDMRKSHRRGLGEYAESGGDTYGEVGGQDDRQEHDSSAGDEWSYQTGWEVEREIYLGNIPDDRRQTHRTSQTESRTKKSNDENRFPDGTNFGITLADGLHGIASLGSIIDNDTDDNEERKKKQQAKDIGAGLGLALGTAAGIVSALATKNEFPQELEYEQEEIEDEFDEDIDEGFNMSM